MITNSSMTLYHKKLNKITKLDVWERYNIEYAMWQGGKGSSFNKGYVDSNDVTVRIPYELNDRLDFSKFAIGDIIIKGTLMINITSQSDLISYDVFNITSAIDNNYGSKKIQHIHLGGK